MALPALRLTSPTRESLYEEIVQSLETLPEVLRAVFVRSHYEARTVSEIAAELKLPRQTVETLLHDANRIFYRQLHRFHFDS